MEPVRCNLCGQNDPTPYISSYDRFSGKLYGLSKCTNCGLIYLTPRPTKDELEQYYPNDYEAYVISNPDEDTRTPFEISNNLLRYLDFIQQFQPRPGKLLDVGCATGNFLDHARKKGWTVLGIEVVEKAAELARDQFDLEVLTTNIESSDLEDSSFDVITLWDVLEHLPDPVNAMRVIHNLLTPGGKVFFSIPNLDSFDRTIFGSDWIGWDSPRHFILFNQAQVEQLMQITGFKLIAKKCLSGGKGAFQLSMDKVIQRRPSLKWIKQFYPLINLLLFPYRQFSYMILRGPIIYYAASRI